MDAGSDAAPVQMLEQGVALGASDDEQVIDVIHAAALGGQHDVRAGQEFAVPCRQLPPPGVPKDHESSDGL